MHAIWAALDWKDILTIGLSAFAFFFSISSFVLTFKQKSQENKRAIRKALTDTISELTSLDIASAQLEIDHPTSSIEPVLSLRRSYNSKRAILANHGELLLEEIPDLASEADYVTLAGAFDRGGDLKKAEQFFEAAVQKSPHDIARIYSVRRLARYYFERGDVEAGRKIYEGAVAIIKVPKDDRSRLTIAETYIYWATIEKQMGNHNQVRRLHALAKDLAEKITYLPMREHILKQVHP